MFPHKQKNNPNEFDEEKEEEADEYNRLDDTGKHRNKIKSNFFFEQCSLKNKLPELSKKISKNEIDGDFLKNKIKIRYVSSIKFSDDLNTNLKNLMRILQF